MFTKKSHADIKKSTAKLQDCKKDSASRLRHLRTILGKSNNNRRKTCFAFVSNSNRAFNKTK